MKEKPQIEYNEEKRSVSLIGSYILSNSDLVESEIYSFSKPIDTIDLKGIENYDSFLLISVKILIQNQKGSEPELIFADENMRSFYNFFNKERKVESKGKKVPGWFEKIGQWGIDIWNDIKYFIEFNGNLAQRSFKVFGLSSKIRWNDLPYQFLNSGVNAFPIVFLILLLIGIITGYQGAIQLRDFGADSYIAPLVGISITRELSPLMTAILVAGRSGSAFAAEIGTMKISEELDALKVVGYDIYDFLIIPRIIAVTIALPILTLLGDVAGLTGGAIAGYSTLDITINSYLNNLQASLTYAHVFSGLFKSLIFGYLVGLVGCFRGTQVGSGADSVGKLTTSSVVTSIFLIIIADAVFTYIFQIIGV